MLNNSKSGDPGLQIVRYSPHQPWARSSPPWFDSRVFYVRISNYGVDDSTPLSLTLIHIPLGPETLIEVNGQRISNYSDGVSSLLRRDRVDKKSEEATFVSTDKIRFTGSVRFEVYDKEDLILSGFLEMCGSNDVTGESKGSAKRWKMDCEAEVTAGSGFLKGKNILGADMPKIEVYVAGSFSASPIILTKTLQLSFRRKHNKKGALDSIPENETTEPQKDTSLDLDLQTSEYRGPKLNYDEDYGNMFWRTEYMDGEDGELSWFNAGVRVGVGIGLGICVGVGIGVGLLVRTYQTTTRNFRRRLL